MDEGIQWVLFTVRFSGETVRRWHDTGTWNRETVRRWHDTGTWNRETVRRWHDTGNWNRGSHGVTVHENRNLVLGICKDVTQVERK